MKLIILLFTFTFSSLFSQNNIFNHDDLHFGCGKYHSIEKIKELKQFELQQAINFPRRNYDILNMDLEFDWRNPLSSTETTGPDRVWTANEKITLKIDSANTNSITFDAMAMQINRIEEINKNLTFEYSINQELVLIFEEDLIAGDTLIFDIDYTYIGQEDRGFLLVSKEDAPERLAYTMSQPYDARYWLICNDYPYEKQMMTLRLKVPSEFIGASNGLYKEKNIYKDFNEFYWEHEYPIASYLMVVNASKFYTYEEKVPRIENPLDSILIDNYIWQVDYTTKDEDDSYFTAEETLDVIPDMVVHFQELFGPYPFEKFGTVTVEKFWAAGMEHQSIQTIRRSLLNRGWGVLAHELGHMWLGDLVTPVSWRDIWLNEGGATWCEALWNEQRKEGGYKESMHSIKRAYIENSGITLEPIYLNDIESHVFSQPRYFLIYMKASWIYHQLKNFIGKEEFFEILKDYLTTYSYQSIDGETFMQFFIDRASNPVFPLRKFFDQFIYSAGHPMINFKYDVQQNESDFEVYIQVEQTQKYLGARHEKTLDAYEFPMVIDYYKDGEIFKDTIIIDEEVYNYSTNLDFQPDSILPDESFSFFHLRNVVASVNTQSISEVNTFPNPISNSEELNINLSIEKSDKYKIELFNIQGQKVYDIYDGYLVEGEFTYKTKIPDNISKGMYFIKISSDTQRIEKLIIK